MPAPDLLGHAPASSTSPGSVGMRYPGSQEVVMEEEWTQGSSPEGVEEEQGKVRDPDLTDLLRRVRRDDPEASSEAYDRVYEHLRRMARQRMSHQPRGHMLDPTGLVHEAYLRLVGERPTDWSDRNHFFAMAATAMRCILADHARAMQAAKRKPQGNELELEGLILAITPESVTFLELNDSIERLAERHPEAAEIVQLRVFAGLSIDEICENTGRPKRTVERLWAYGKARLKQDLLDVGS